MLQGIFEDKKAKKDLQRLDDSFSSKKIIKLITKYITCEVIKR